MYFGSNFFDPFLSGSIGSAMDQQSLYQNDRKFEFLEIAALRSPHLTLSEPGYVTMKFCVGYEILQCNFI